MGLDLYLWAKRTFASPDADYASVLDATGLRSWRNETTSAQLVDTRVLVAHWQGRSAEALMYSLGSLGEAAPDDAQTLIDRETLHLILNEADEALSGWPSGLSPMNDLEAVDLRDMVKQLSRVLTLPSDVELYYQAVG